MTDVVVVRWRSSRRRIILADYDDPTAELKAREGKDDAESIRWLAASEAWKKYPPAPGTEWSHRAVVILVKDLEDSWQEDRARKVVEFYRRTSSRRRLSQLRILMSRKILERKKR